MPTLSISTALLILGKTDSLPWNCMVWQGLTKVTSISWTTLDYVDPDSPSSNLKEWSVLVTDSIKIYDFRRMFTDNNTAGQHTWADFIKLSIWMWKFNQIVDNVFKDSKVTLYEAIAQVKSNVINLMLTLFRDDIFQKDSLFLVVEIKDFSDAVIVNT
ncbi:hypothetical protein J3R82DRAFT_2839 [Butyriboletus roseoflavus]|nr:hypothetical protein J3R82DRAFT_2839 [Butyriboletus roseoflavus]